MSFALRAKTTYDAVVSSSPYNFSIDKPSGTQNGDLLLCMISWYDFASYTYLDLIPSGWQELASTIVADYLHFHLFYKVASSEPSSFGWSFSGMSKVSAVCACYMGDYKTSDPFDAISNTQYIVDNNQCKAASFNVANSNSPLLFFGLCYSTSEKTYTKPTVPTSGWVEDHDGGSVDSNFWTEICSMIWSGSGATGDIVATISDSLIYKHAFAIAVKPVGAPGPESVQSFHPVAMTEVSKWGAQYKVPTSDSDVDGEWASSPYYSKVDESSPNTTDYITCSTSDKKAVFGFTAFSLPSGKDNYLVRVRLHAKYVGTSGQIKAIIKVNGTVYEGDAVDLSTDWDSGLYYDWVNNPDTGSPWTYDDINGSGSHPIEAFGAKTGTVDGTVYLSTTHIVASYGAEIWTTIDDPIIPAGATGAILKGRAFWGSELGLRKKGSSDTSHNRFEEDAYLVTAIGVDEDGAFEIFLGYPSGLSWWHIQSLDATHLYIVGYTTDGVTFLTNPVEKTLTSSGTWEDMDCSSACPGAYGVMFQIHTDIYSNDWGIRNKNSTDNRYYGSYQSFAVIGVSYSQICEGYAEDKDGITFRIIGYVTKGAIFAVNAPNVDITAIAEWEDMAQLPSLSVMGIYEVWGYSMAGIRMKGDVPDTVFGKPGGYDHLFAISPCDSNRYCQARRDLTAMHFYQTGYAIEVVAQYSTDVLLQKAGVTTGFSIDSALAKLGIPEILSHDLILALRSLRSISADTEFERLSLLREMTIDTILKIQRETGINLDLLLKMVGLEIKLGIDLLIAEASITWQATLHGQITDTGGQNSDERGFVWDTSEYGDPGDTPPDETSYASYWTEGGSFGLGVFEHTITGLIPDTTYYFRACSHNAAGWSYGVQKTFSTAYATIPLTIDALLQRLGIGRPYVIDTMLSGTTQTEYFSDAVLSKFLTTNISIDVLLALSELKGFLASDTVLERLGVEQPYSIDSLFGLAIIKALDSDMLLSYIIQANLGTDTVLALLALKAYMSVDALLEKTEERTIDFDALLHRLDIPIPMKIDVILGLIKLKLLSIDSLIKKLGVDRQIVYDTLLQIAKTTDFDTDAVLALHNELGSTIDALLRLLLSTGFSVDVLLERIGLDTSLYLDTLLKGISEQGITTDVLFRKLNLSQHEIDSLIVRKAIESGHDIDAVLALITSRELSNDALLKQLGLGRSVSIDAVFGFLHAKQLNVDALIKQLELDQALVTDALLKTMQTIEVSIDSVFQLIVTSQMLVDTLLLATTSEAISIDTILEATHLSIAHIDALFKKLGVELSVTSDSMLEISRTTDGEFDAVLEITGLETDMVIRAVLIAALQDEVSIDTCLQKLGIQTAMFADAFFGLFYRQLYLDAYFTQPAMILGYGIDLILEHVLNAIYANVSCIRPRQNAFWIRPKQDAFINRETRTVKNLNTIR